MMVATSVALMSYAKPDTFFSGSSGSKRGKAT